MAYPLEPDRDEMRAIASLGQKKIRRSILILMALSAATYGSVAALLAGDATMLYYQTEEAHEGSRAFLEKRKPDFSKYPRRP